MELEEKIKHRQTEIQRAWDAVQDEIYWTERAVTIQKEELKSLDEKLKKAKAWEFQIFKKAQRLNCQEIL